MIFYYFIIFLFFTRLVDEGYFGLFGIYEEKTLVMKKRLMKRKTVIVQILNALC